MPYRTLARNEHAELDHAEIEAIRRQARIRVWRVMAVIAGAFVLVLGGAVAAASSGQTREKLHCHHVTIEYETPDHSTPPPPATRLDCEWR
jgi:hypothetical protein